MPSAAYPYFTVDDDTIHSSHPITYKTISLDPILLLSFPTRLFSIIISSPILICHVLSPSLSFNLLSFLLTSSPSVTSSLSHTLSLPLYPSSLSLSLSLSVCLPLSVSLSILGDPIKLR